MRRGRNEETTLKRKASWLTFALALGTLIMPLSSEAQQARRPHRIGALTMSYAPNHPAVEGLKAGLTELGFEEGRNVTFDIRFTRGNPQAVPAAAEALVNAGADLIFASNAITTRAAKAATQTIPIVFAQVIDPVGAGVVTGLAHPGGNVTGILNPHLELLPDQVEMLKAIVPTLQRVWAIYAADDPSFGPAIGRLEATIRRLRLELVARPVRTPEEVAQAFAALHPGDGLLQPPSTALNIYGEILDRSAQVPAVFRSAFWVRYGGLASYGPDYDAEGREAARLVAKILRGARPQDLPVEAPEKIELAINLKTAKALGLTIPPSVLVRADQVIQ